MDKESKPKEKEVKSKGADIGETSGKSDSLTEIKRGPNTRVVKAGNMLHGKDLSSKLIDLLTSDANLRDQVNLHSEICIHSKIGKNIEHYFPYYDLKCSTTAATTCEDALKKWILSKIRYSKKMNETVFKDLKELNSENAETLYCNLAKNILTDFQ